MRRFLAIAGMTTALSLGSVSAHAFQETPPPPPPDATEAPKAKAKGPAPMKLGTPATQATPEEARKGVNVFGYNLFPKLDFGLDLLYGQDAKHTEPQQPGTALDDANDVSVVGKVKRRF
jgi:hypothetical protein